MFHSRFLWRLFASYAALILISIAVIGGMILNRMENDSLEEIKRSLKSQVILFKDIAAGYLTGPAGDSIREHIRSLGAELGTRLTIIDAEGVVLADSQKDPAIMDNYATRPEILAARSHGYGISTRYSSALGSRMMYLAIPIKRYGALLGYARVSVSLISIDDRISRLRSIVAGGAGAAMVVALLFGLLIARRFSRPITQMTPVAESMAAGDYTKRLPNGRTDEIGKLSITLNRLAEKLTERVETISKDRNKLQAILESMVEGVIAVDDSERIIHMNLAAGKIIGVLHDECIGKPVWEVTRLREICEILSATIKNKREIESDLKITSRGNETVVEMYASPVFDAGAELVGAVVALHDVSQIHNLERIRRDFVANASHELKTPITAIRGMVETMIDDERMPKENRTSFLAKMRDQSIRLSTIVTDILTLARLESAGGLLEKTRTNLGDLVMAAASPFRVSAQEKGVSLETEFPGAPIYLPVDREAISLVVSNLLDNALKHTPGGGLIWVRLNAGESAVTIEIADTGIGIDPIHHPRIFERFYRVDKARSRELGGTGLGLYIVKHIALSHGGVVTVQSEPGEGSVFRVVLPSE